jgi:hypothetical protein
LATLAWVLLLLTATTLALSAAALLTATLTRLLVLLVVASTLTALAWLALIWICHYRFTPVVGG